MEKVHFITKKLEASNKWWFALYTITAAFITYFSMYAFRKPFSAGTFEDFSVWGIDYKVFAVFFQLVGYTLSKFFGIKIIAEMKESQRVVGILVLIGIAWVALLLFGITHAPYNLLWLFVNGIPLGMIWGVVYSFLEGRTLTELLGAGLSTSFIVSSGVVKAVGRSLVLDFGISEFWMPFFAGLIFIPTLLLGVYLLSKLPPPNDEDRANRTERVPMDGAMRMAFFKKFSVGIILTAVIYVFLTVFRDIRDNFAVEIWEALGLKDRADILATSEIPIAIGVMIIIGLMITIKDNIKAFNVNIGMMIFGGVTLLATTFFWQMGFISPILWMIMSGFGMYLAYIAYHTFLFERWIAVFKIKSNIGFLMYIVDAFGYLASSIVLFAKSFIAPELNWLEVFKTVTYTTGFVTLILGLVTFSYFLNKQRAFKVKKEIEHGKN